MARNHVDLDKTGLPAFPDERLHSLPEAEDDFKWNHAQCPFLSSGSLRWIGSNRNSGWLYEAEAGIKIARRNTNNLRYADDTTLMAESKEELKSLLLKVKEESENASLKLNIQKTKITASGPITSQQIDGGKMETVKDFIFLGSRITVDGDCSHEIKRHLILGTKAITNLERVLISRGITLLTKVCLVKAMVFPVVLYIVRVGP